MAAREHEEARVTETFPCRRVLRVLAEAVIAEAEALTHEAALAAEERA